MSLHDIDLFGLKDPWKSNPFGTGGALAHLEGPLRAEFQRKHAEACLATMHLKNERLAIENEAFRNLNEAERIRLAAELLKLQGQAGNSSFGRKPLHAVNG